MRIDIPKSYDKNKPYKLIFGMQCMGGWAGGVQDEGYYGLKPFDKNETVIFVAPEGNGNQAPWAQDDYLLFDELLAYLEGNFCIDSSRVFSTGFSYGSMFSNGLSWNHQDVLRAVAVYETAERNIWLPQRKKMGIGWMGVLGLQDDLCRPEMGRAARDIILEHTAKFIMPSSAVTVTPVFTKLSDLYVNMPKNRTIEVHIPESVASFKVYDDGGDTGNYSDEANGTLKLIPTDGWTLNVAGKAALRSGDVFKIQNAVKVTPKEGTPYLWCLDDFYENNGSSDGTEVDIEPQTVSQVAVVSLVSDDAGNAAGINLTVTKVRTTFGAVGVAYVKGDFWGNLYGGHEKVAVIDSAYNGTDAVSITDDIEVDTVIYNRKFIKDTYSTMVLPFSVRTKNVSGIDAVLYYNGIGTDKDGNDAVRMKVLWAADGVIKDDKGNSVSYKDTVMKANTPYLVGQYT